MARFFHNIKVFNRPFKLTKNVLSHAKKTEKEITPKENMLKIQKTLQKAIKKECTNKILQNYYPTKDRT